MQKITDAQSEAKSKLSDTHIDEQATLAVKHKAEDDALTKKYTFGKDMFGNSRTLADLTKERAALDLKQENEKKTINLKHILEKSNQSLAHENQKNIAATAIEKQYASNAANNPPSTVPANVPIEPKRNYTRKFREGLSAVGSKIGSGVSAVGSGVSAVGSGAIYSARKIKDATAYGANKLKPVTEALGKTASVGYNVLAKGASVGTNILGSGASMLHQGVKSLSNHQFTNPDPYSSNGSGGGNSSAGSSNLCESQSQNFIREFFAHITNKQSNMSDMLVRSLINALGDVVKNNSTGLMNEITSIFGQINNNLQQQMGQNAFMILILNLINSQGELFVDSIADTFNAKPAVELPAYVKTQEFSDKVYENFVKKLSKMVETTK